MHTFDLKLHAARQQQSTAPGARHAEPPAQGAGRSHGGSRQASGQPPGVAPPRGKFASTAGPEDHGPADPLAPLAPGVTALDVDAGAARDGVADPAAKAKTSTSNDASAETSVPTMAAAMLALLMPSAPATPSVAHVAGTGAGNGADVTVGGGKHLAAAADMSGLMLAADTAGPTVTAAAALLTGHDALGAAVGAGLRHAGADKDALRDPLQAAALLASPANALRAPTLPLQVQAPVGSPAFGHELGQQVAWLGGQDVKQASIRLHPEELGQLDVKISVTHDRVDVVFNAQHPAAVIAVQQTLPHLDHMLAQHGLSLGHAEVGQQSRGDRHDARGGDARAVATGSIEDSHGISQPASTGTISLLDAFA
jgi:flagellar hook-length control protein FliK